MSKINHTRLITELEVDIKALEEAIKNDPDNADEYIKAMEYTQNAMHASKMIVKAYELADTQKDSTKAKPAKEKPSKAKAKAKPAKEATPVEAVPSALDLI